MSPLKSRLPVLSKYGKTLLPNSPSINIQHGIIPSQTIAIEFKAINHYYLGLCFKKTVKTAHLGVLRHRKANVQLGKKFMSVGGFSI